MIDFVIGGAPKCATTAVFDYLAQHPDVFASSPKEPHYFASAALGRTVMQGNYTRDEYLDLFAGKKPHQKGGEGSTHYLHHANAVAPRLAKEAPDARLIFCLRDPVDRAYSHFLFRYSTAGPYTLGGIGDGRRFLEFAGDPEIYAMSDYAPNLAIFYEHFPPEQILVLLFEDVVRDIPGALHRICKHIGVDPDFAFDTSRISNETEYPRAPSVMQAADKVARSIYIRLPAGFRPLLLRLRKALLFSTDAPKPRLPQDVREAAEKLYQPAIERLRQSRFAAELRSPDVTVSIPTIAPATSHRARWLSSEGWASLR